MNAIDFGNFKGSFEEVILTYEEKIGQIIEKSKFLEYLIDCIIVNYIKPNRGDFLKNIILNSTIMGFGPKIKILKTICLFEGLNFDFNDLHKLGNVRNLFAHENSYVESLNIDALIKMDELKSDGKYISIVFDKKYEEFLNIFKKEKKLLSKLNEELSRKHAKNNN